MEYLLLKFVAIVRPIGSMQFAEKYVDIIGVGIFALLMLTLLSNSAVRKSLRLSSVDISILAFCGWSIAIYLIYIEYAYMRDLAKIVIPMLGYIAAKNTLRSIDDYRNLLGWLILSFSIPTVVSTIMIINGTGVDFVSYWTGIERWSGAYDGSHSLGLSMTLLLIVITLYVQIVQRIDGAAFKSLGYIKGSGLILLSGAALFCLYMSQVRTAILGLLVFAAVTMFFQNKKLLVISGAVGTFVAVAFLPYWLPALLPEFTIHEQGVEVTTEDLGSGRPRMWMNDLKVFAELPIDRQIAGIGIGNRGDQATDVTVYGHSDWLELLVQTGIVGLIFYLVFQILLFRAILRMPGRDRYAFLAVFAAVNVMMAVSNAFVWRIQVSQLFFIMFAYVEIQNLQQKRNAYA